MTLFILLIIRCLIFLRVCKYQNNFLNEQAWALIIFLIPYFPFHDTGFTGYHW